MDITQTQIYQSHVSASSTHVQPCDECGFEDELTYIALIGELPTNVCRFCLSNFPAQYSN